MKILNLYAGIGGNRKLWGDEHEITAVENQPEIAKIYKDFFPKDSVIVTDAHQYLLEHYQEYDFIWSSPPCPTHSRFRNLKNNITESEKKYPDMKLYEEIIFLMHFFKGKFVVENVISYYEPLIEPQKSQNHYFWSNFAVPFIEPVNRGIRRGTNKPKEERLGINLDKFDVKSNLKSSLLNNCVDPELGLVILESTNVLK